MISIEYLARHFPVSGEEIKQKIRIYQKEVKNIKIKTKSLVAQRLMKVALAVHLSRQKREAKARRDVKNYYGTFNGTVGERSKRIIIEKPTTNDQIYSFQHSEPKANIGEAQEIDSCIFYIFPVKLFENSKALSIIFSLVINIAFGLLLSLTLFLTDNLQNGAYAHLFYGVLLLPLLPNASKIDFFTSMTLSSLWKYCLYGVLICFSCISQGSGAFNLGISESLTFSPAIQLLAMSILTSMVISQSQPKYQIIFVWIAAIALNAIFLFKSS